VAYLLAGIRAKAEHLASATGIDTLGLHTIRSRGERPAGCSTQPHKQPGAQETRGRRGVGDGLTADHTTPVISVSPRYSCITTPLYAFQISMDPLDA
jgi:hypothetical protein